MCVVIDACCIPKVFNSENQHHANYAPVLEWVSNGKGRMIYGGTKYSAELRKLSRYLGVIAELNRNGRAVQLPCAKVDVIANGLKARIADADFNDEHLVAIVIVSKCCVVCTDDEAAIYYLKMREIYSGHGMKKPKIYHSIDHKKLCCNKNVHESYGH